MLLKGLVNTMIGEISKVPFDLLENFMRDVFISLGVPEEDAGICADVLITADKRGIHSHGVNRLKPMYYDRIKAGMIAPGARMEIVREGPTTAVMDGHFSMGHAVAKRSMDLAISKAKQYGLGMVAVRNSTHYGIAGYYSLMAAQEGMIGINGTNARPAVAPTFGTEGFLGTNPFTIGFPTDEDFPFVLDCATSIWQRGKIEYYARQGKEIPRGLVISSDGETIIDSRRILEELLTGDAALLPLGGPEETAGYKGYGYSTVVEVLSSALQANSFLKAVNGVNVGHFFMAVDIESFISLDEFRKNSGDIMRDLRSSRRIPGQDRIYTAGEKEHLYWLENKDLGVPLEGTLQKELVEMRDELSMAGYTFPFE
jgi:LDH2 family malate/lactate/ureidoglycolate dehydrogenase